MPTVTASGATVTEGDSSYETLNFTIQLDEVSSERVVVPYSLVGGSILPQTDSNYTNGSYAVSTVVFNPGETVKQVKGYPSGDFAAEADESLVLELYKPQNARLPGDAISTQTVGWTLDDDGNAIPRALWVSNPIVLEGDAGTAEVTFDLSISRPATTDIAIPFRFGGSATEGTDYDGEGGTVVFKAGETEARITMTVTGDTDLETLEHVILDFDLPADQISESWGGVATIVDDDAGDGPYALIAGRSIGETDSSYGTVTYTVMLTEPTSERVSVPWVVDQTGPYAAERSYTGGSYDSNSVTFNAGEMIEALKVYPTNDPDAEPDETVTVDIKSPTNARLPGNVSNVGETVFVIDDDDDAAPLTLAVSNPQVRETDTNDATAGFVFELSRPAPTDMVIAWHTVDGTATAGEDYRAASGTVTIGQGQRMAAIGVEVYADNYYEEHEDFSLEFTLPGNLPRVAGAEATILNDDLVTDVGTPREPVTPTEPTDPVEPTEPTDPVTPTEPTDPVEPTDPTTPVAGELITGTNRRDWLEGGAGDDTIDGIGKSDRLFGEGGDDSIDGGGGKDKVSGGDGDDTIAGGGGRDKLFGDDGADTVSGETGRDRISGGAGNDALSGGLGNDKLEGGDGDDELSGDGGRDRLEGNAGDDLLSGDGGADTFVFRPGDGTDTIADFVPGVDRIAILDSVDSVAGLSIDQDGADAVVSFDDTVIRLLGTDANDLAGPDFVFDL